MHRGPESPDPSWGISPARILRRWVQRECSTVCSSVPWSPPCSPAYCHSPDLGPWPTLFVITSRPTFMPQAPVSTPLPLFSRDLASVKPPSSLQGKVSLPCYLAASDIVFSFMACPPLESQHSGGESADSEGAMQGATLPLR